MKLMTRKAQIGNIQGFVLAIVGVAVVLAVGLIVLSELQASQCQYGVSGGVCVNSTGGTGSIGETVAFNSTGSIITKLATVPTWIGILIIVALAFIVLSFFSGRQ